MMIASKSLDIDIPQANAVVLGSKTQFTALSSLRPVADTDVRDRTLPDILARECGD